jgi:hypothetical protein
MLIQEEFYSESGSYSYLLGMEGARGKILIDPTEDCLAAYAERLGRVGRDRVFTLETGSVSASCHGSLAIARRWRTRRVVPCDLFQGSDLIAVGHGDAVRLAGMAVEVVGRVGRLNEAVSYRIGNRVFVGDRQAHQEPELLMLPPETQVYCSHADPGQNRDHVISAQGVLSFDSANWGDPVRPFAPALPATAHA